MKKLSIMAILVLAISIFLIPSICFADVAAVYHLTAAYVTMTAPDYGDNVPMDLSAGKQINVSNIVWKDPNGKVLTSTSRIVEAGKYTLTFDLDRVGGDRFAASTYVYVNSSIADNKTCKSQDKIEVVKTFDIVANKRLSNASGKAQYMDEANYKTVSTIKATINGPKQGEPLDQSPKMEETEGAIVVGVVWERLDTTTNKWVEITDKEYKAEVAVQYRASILFKFDVGFKIDPNVKEGWVNTWNVCPVSGHNTSAHVITSLTFSIRPTNSSAGSRPSTSTTTDTATETTSTPTRPTTGTLPSRPSTSNTTPTRPSTTLSSGEKEIKTSGDALPVEETKPSGETKPAEEAKPSGETKPVEEAKPSGETKPEETKPEEKPSETKPEEKVETIVWTKASTWAIDELNQANETGLIPTLFDKQDLTKNVTRKEFAYIAVKLYEKLTGKKAEAVSKNPFTDTKDTEVLKAYNLEITTGTSDTTFTPDKEITREQMAAMMQRALKAAGIDTKVDLNKVSKFADDADLHDWSREAVYFMSGVEIIKGVGNNNFGAKGTATREQALVISIRSAEEFKK